MAPAATPTNQPAALAQTTPAQTSPAQATLSTQAAPGVVAWDWQGWAAAYPALAVSVAPEQAQGAFTLACLCLNNTPGSVVGDVTQRQALLWLLVAHILQLGLNQAAAASGGASPGSGGLVGRVSSASRGSVSISTDGGGIPSGAWWYAQTPWGAAFWQATAWLRQMRCLPGRSHPALTWP
ncbi:DUF4054 domain-containing protein [Formicincola oecophyllae]|uniref:DUF4054 domain-containing protein n=1 Tax=Formicincola oecophyllae TaxID=2558361 RepID=A0A4Y6UEM8_9PROT|nr:DUF4054 domain-containing protein [Formicincola oecophyllae]QDH14495.1 DUF4054 domain-containing protein [Formicincola oecophyllae]